MPPTDLLDQSATAQIAAVRAGDISAPELMAATLDRIAERNGRVNAIVALRERDVLMAEATAQTGKPLAGLPIAIKDLAETKGITTTYGSPLFKTHRPAADNAMVAALKSAGAVVIGKTNTPEFGLGSHSYNPVYGVTRNPYDPSCSAGGSSGGAGAALATRMVAFADGSDMMGSLRNPAAWNNVFGFRPSYGLVANSGPAESFFNQLSTNGPMARHMGDLELLLGLQSAHDPAHPHSSGPYQSTEGTGRLRIGWLGDWGGAYPMESGVLELCESGLKVLETLGHEVVTLEPPFSAAALWDSWITQRSWAVAEKLRPIYKDTSQRDFLKPAAIWEIERGLSMSAHEIFKASEIRSDWFRRTANLQVDLLALPSAQMFAFPAEWDWPKEIAGSPMDTYHRWMEVVVPASLTGLPALSVPVGFGPGGTPMGMQLIGHRGNDATVLALGRAYEAATDWVSRQPR
ncbi:amidase [Litoreibacter ascidiaceicola]|uniref:Amidase n=1 Tax=Litoreibacter ascidiaceicola TaxID=1486859 RepID=A0A1M5B745_9RHOB|nr:amidase [Litoreibacter ascidiaceicola]SHF38371.1 amidase [Litoreibacter ascidiaceicola]